MTMGMQSIQWSSGVGLWRLDDAPCFQMLCLDQGYWPATFLTPESSYSLEKDVVCARKMGFNGCRKYQKVEVRASISGVDRKGFLV